MCSLEPWDEVWRRNQFLLDQLLGRNPRLRVLFVEPPSDILFDLWNRRPLRRPRLRVVGYEGRLRAFRPLKPLPRRLGGLADAALLRQVEVASRLAGFSRPVLWINDVSYAPLIERTGWPSIYDVTDDWLLAPFGERELGRLRRLDRLALSRSDEVVVCSKALAASRRPVQRLTVIPNAADVEHFKRPRRRPPDLPQTPVMVYVGTLQEGRLDVGLVAELARDLPSVALVLVGPDALSQASRNRLAALPNLVLLGPRPYEDVPAYFQHADVFVIPHVVSPFTDSLDPIKAYECAAVGVPTVTTPVAGLRCEGPSLRVAARPSFPREVKRLLRERPPRTPATVPTWQTRSEQYEEVIGSALRRSNQRAFT